MLKKLEDKRHLYGVSQDAARAICWALSDAITDEVCATDFGGSERLTQLERLHRQAEPIYQQLTGAYSVLTDMYLEQYEQSHTRNHLDSVGLSAWYQWNKAKETLGTIDERCSA